jgi:chaperonin GroEL (HSP60 family)
MVGYHYFQCLLWFSIKIFIYLYLLLLFFVLWVLEYVVAGAGAFEVAAHRALIKYKEQVKGRARLGVQAFADAMLVIPKVLAQNAGFDPQDSIVKMQQELVDAGPLVGLDLQSGEPSFPADLGIFDNYRVKKQILHSWLVHSIRYLNRTMFKLVFYFF